MLRLHVEPHQVDVRRLPATPRGELVRRNQQRMRRAAARHGVSNLRLFGSTARGDATYLTATSICSYTLTVSSV